MVSIVSNVPTTPQSTAQKSPNGTTRASIFYLNDIHGQISKMERIETASKAFDSFTPSTKTDKLKFASGDVLLGEDLKVNKSAVQFLNSIGITATAVGNHELDISPQDLVDLTKDANFKMLGLNANIDQKNPLNQKITKSYIEEKDGAKYGVIGLMPIDLFTRLKYKERFEGLNVDKIEETIKEVQSEVDEMQKKGINKIILLSHIGYSKDVKIAKEVTGIDVILGGHSHDLIEGIQEGKNLFYSQKTGDATIITQTGKDGNYFGVLNVEFDDKGTITTAQNNVTSTNKFQKNASLGYIFDTIFGKAIKVGEIASSTPFSELAYTNENPHANFFTDAMRSELKTDIAILNSANLRGTFEVGKITDRDISEITPFKNQMTIMTINEKELVDALKHGAKSMTKPDHKPGILQVSGLKYTINKGGKLIDAKFLDKTGKEVLIDINNPNNFKTYSVAIDDYYAKGKDDFSMLKKIDKLEKLFDFDKDKLAIDYMKKMGKPVDIKPDGRITVID